MKNLQNILKWSVIVGLFLIPFIPFIVPGAMFFPFITGKGFAFRILVEILFGMYVVLACVMPEYRPKMSWITKAVCAFLLALFISDLLSANPYKSFWSNYERMEGFVLLVHLVMFYIVASSVFKTSVRWIQFLNLSIIASALMSVYGFFQLVGMATINQGGVRLDGTFGNATYLAIYLVFHIFLCLYMLLDASKPKWQKWTYGAIALFEVFILYFTATRGAILGLIGGLLLSGVLVTWKEKENQKLRKIAYWVLGTIALLFIGFMLIRKTSFVRNSPVLSRFSTLGVSEFHTQGRYYVWPMAVKGVLERPVFGWGQESFNFVFNKYYDPQMFGQEEWFDRTHDVVLDWLIAGGIVGFLAYASMYVAMLHLVWRKKSPMKLSEKSVFTGMISAYIFHNIFVFDNLISYILFFSLLAYVHSMSVSSENPDGFAPKMLPEKISLYVVSPVVLVLTIIAIYFVNVPALRANSLLIQAIQPQQSGPEKNLEMFKQIYAYNSFGSTETTEQLVSVVSQIANATDAQVPATTRQMFYDFTKNKIEEKLAQTPHDTRYLVFAGSFFNRFSKYDEAMVYLNRALAESPKKQSIFIEMGSSYLGKGDTTSMFASFKKAYDLAPNKKDAQIVYAIGALYTKNAEVLKEMSAVLGADTIVSDNRFLQTYAQLGDYNAVINILNARIAKEPNNTQYKLSLASAYATIGQKQKAIDIINAMIASDPSFKTQGEEYIKQINGF